MPLQLGGAETDRPHLITYDPTKPAEVEDATKRRTSLLAQGFVQEATEEGRWVFNPPPKGPHVGVFRILSQNGDDRVVWDRRDGNQVRDAMQKFKQLIDGGHTAYAIGVGGKRGHKLTMFDPSLEEILFVPATRPG